VRVQLVDKAQRGMVQLVVELVTIRIKLEPPERQRRVMADVLPTLALEPSPQPTRQVHRDPASRAQALRRERIQIFAPAVVQAVVAGAQEHADHGRAGGAKASHLDDLW
jgi:hypothetical protein